MSNLFRAMKLIKRTLGGDDHRPGRRGQGGGGGGGGEEDDDLLRINPQDTDGHLSEWFEPHIVAVDPSVPQTGRLVLFLPGSYGHPGRQTTILRVAAHAGHRAINLTYPNSWTVAGVCRKSNDPDAHGKVRRQIVEGGPDSRLVSMQPADSIINRLARLLRYLQSHQPDQQWGQFLHEGDPVWSKIEVAGHSQGGGHAAYIAQRYAVAKAVMLGAPSDHCAVTNGPAQWLRQPGATPGENYFGFCHRRDPGYNRVLEGWRLLAGSAYTPPADVDREAPPYGNRHFLSTDLEAPGEKYHGSVATDAAAPMGPNGRNAFLRVWDYLFRSGQSAE